MNRRLDAAELADAAMSAALVMGLLTVGRLLAAGTAFQVLATIVLAVLAARRRLRTVASATVASMALAVLLGGIGPISQAFVAGIYGYAGGVSLRHRWSLTRHVGYSLAVGWPIVSLLSVGFLAIFADLRRLTLDNARNQWDGLAKVLERVGLRALAADGSQAVEWSIRHWWLMIPVVQIAISIGYSLIVRRIGRAVLDRVDAALGEPWAVDGDAAAPEVGPPQPLPLTLGDVMVRRGEAELDLGWLDVRIEPGHSTALLGGNGSGKTSLIDAIAGLVASTGIEAAGPIGLGRRGGTALIGQRPESQVLGIRVIDDMRWGLDADVDPLPLLERVGLTQLVDQPTSELSGGELQRLAVAAALAREPALLLSDESTAMLDPVGRAEVRTLLLEAAERGAGVVHSTHLGDDVGGFERAIRLDDGADVASHRWVSHPGAAPTPLLTVEGVGYIHNAGTPWARRVLAGVELVVGRGELTVVVGANGSGKTTLARLLAGLITASEGTISFEGRPLVEPDNRIGIAFQHARLQLLRSTVRAELYSLSGGGDADQALAVVGLDPTEMSGRRVDDLSSGQQRLVLLAGMIARSCDVVVLDEPLAGLDLPAREHLAHGIDALLSRGTGVVIISHDPGWAVDRADSVLDLDRLAVSWGLR